MPFGGNFTTIELVMPKPSPVWNEKFDKILLNVAFQSNISKNRHTAANK